MRLDIVPNILNLLIRTPALQHTLSETFTFILKQFYRTF